MFFWIYFNIILFYDMPYAWDLYNDETVFALDTNLAPKILLAII